MTDELGVPQLKALLKQNGLSDGGNKSQLQARYNAFLASQANGQGAGDKPKDDETKEENSDSDLTSLSASITGLLGQGSAGEENPKGDSSEEGKNLEGSSDDKEKDLSSPSNSESPSPGSEGSSSGSEGSSLPPTPEVSSSPSPEPHTPKSPSPTATDEITVGSSAPRYHYKSISGQALNVAGGIPAGGIKSAEILPHLEMFLDVYVTRETLPVEDKKAKK